MAPKHQFSFLSFCVTSRESDRDEDTLKQFVLFVSTGKWVDAQTEAGCKRGARRCSNRTLTSMARQASSS